MQSIHTKYLKGRNDIVFVGLNATQEAVQADAVFCMKKTFWKVLYDAGLITGVDINSLSPFPYDLMADKVFITNELCRSGLHLGFTDIIDDNQITSSNSNNVKVLQQHLDSLKTRLSNAHPSKIALLGKRVAKEFLRLDSTLLKEWEEKKKLADKDVYGKLGSTLLAGNLIEIYVVPFPETSPVEKKHEYYSKLI